MIFLYSDLLKDKLKKKYNKYDKYLYDEYYKIGITKISLLIKEYADNINESFIDFLVNSDNIEIVFYSNDSNKSITDNIGIIIYTKSINNKTKKENIYLLLLCIQKEYRKFGYGKILLEEFIKYIKDLNTNDKKIILHPLISSIYFYKTFGFSEILDKPCNYKKLFKFERYNKEISLLSLDL